MKIVNNQKQEYSDLKKINELLDVNMDINKNLLILDGNLDSLIDNEILLENIFNDIRNKYVLNTYSKTYLNYRSPIKKQKLKH
ncbi:MAG: hypothetical protein ACRCXT_08910 [Paraclostridium sp.]